MAAVVVVKKKTQKSKEYQTLEYLCQQNDISIKSLKKDGAEVKKLEMFFGGYPELIGLRFFSSLTSLTLIGQDISSVANLKHISSTLTDLWICECKIQKLDGLETCTKMKHLYLYDNKINDCTQISNLLELELLWLNNNQITSIQFLDNLYSLKEINLARNLISDKSLQQIVRWPFKVSQLNLSQNDIYEIKSLTKITQCKNLESLSFADPNYGKCPVCENIYYVPWICFHFPNIVRLDGKEMKDGTLASKKALSLKLEMESKLRSENDKFYVESQIMNANFLQYHTLLTEHIRAISNSLSVVKPNETKLNHSLLERKQFWCRLLAKLHNIRCNLSNIMKLKTEMQKLKVHISMENCSNKTADLSEFDWITDSVKQFYCSQQLLYLDISDINILGCIPFSDQSNSVSPNEVFFTVYENPLTSDIIRNLTYNVHELDEYTFFQNFFLLTWKLFKKEESHLCSLVVVKSSELSRKSKQLCNIKDFIQTDKNNTKTDTINECACTDNKVFHRIENVRLFDYEFLAVVFVEFINHKMFGFSSDSLLKDIQPSFVIEEIEKDKQLFDHSKIILPKEIPQNILSDKNLSSLTLSFSNIEDVSPLNELTLLIYLDLSFNKISSLIALKNVQKLQTLKVLGNFLSSWFTELNHLKFYCSNLQNLDIRLNLWSLNEEKKLESVAKSFFSALYECNKKKTEIIDEPLQFQKMASLKYADRIWTVDEKPLFLNCENWANLFKGYGCTPFTGDRLKETKWYKSVTGLNIDQLNLTSLQNFDHFQKLKFLTLDENPLVDISTLTSLLNLRILSMDHCYIEKFPDLKHLNYLTELSLQFNNLEDLSFCKYATNLQKLNVTGNNISSLDDVHFLNNLTEIILARNPIGHIQDIKVLKTIVTLTVLDLTGNQIQQVANYRPHVVHLLRNVEVLDESLVTVEERKQSDEAFGRTLNLDFLSSRFDSNQLLKSTYLKLNQLGLQTVTLPEDNYLNHIQSLDLSENKFKYFGDIINIKNLEQLSFSSNCFQRIFHAEDLSDNLKILTKLKVLYLDQNNISKLQTLQLNLLPSLVELHLQNNKLTHIQGLDSLTNLELLDLSYNKITSISTHSLIGQQKLKFLSLAYNRLKELTHISKLESLEFLDISFNSIHSLQNIKNMDSLKHLTTFKCTGNPVCKRNVYQHFFVSHIPSLKSIDEKILSSDDKEMSIQTMQTHNKKLLKTTNVGHEYGDEEELNQRPNNGKMKSIKLPKLFQQPLISSSSQFSTFSKPFKMGPTGVHKPRRIEALNLSVERFNYSTANKTFQVFGRPCSIERRNFKRK